MLSGLLLFFFNCGMGFSFILVSVPPLQPNQTGTALKNRTWEFARLDPIWHCCTMGNVPGFAPGFDPPTVPSERRTRHPRAPVYFFPLTVLQRQPWL